MSTQTLSVTKASKNLKGIMAEIEAKKLEAQAMDEALTISIGQAVRETVERPKTKQSQRIAGMSVLDFAREALGIEVDEVSADHDASATAIGEESSDPSSEVQANSANDSSNSAQQYW